MLPYLREFSVEPNPHATTNGYRYDADFRIRLAGVAYPTLIGTVSWNATKTLLPHSTRTETKVTEADFSVWRAGLGWAKLEDVSGFETAWIDMHNTVIRFRKKVLLSVPVTPLFSDVPILKEL